MLDIALREVTTNDLQFILILIFDAMTYAVENLVNVKLFLRFN
jgi:hypothetical protein